MTVRRKETWHCTLGNHSKQYILTIEDLGGRFTLTAEWGRIGAQNLQSKVYVDRGMRHVADSMWDRLEEEKVGKGYQSIGSSMDEMPEDVERTGWPDQQRSRPAARAIPTLPPRSAPKPEPVPKKKSGDEEPGRKIWL